MIRRLKRGTKRRVRVTRMHRAGRLRTVTRATAGKLRIEWRARVMEAIKKPLLRRLFPDLSLLPDIAASEGMAAKIFYLDLQMNR